MSRKQPTRQHLEADAAAFAALGDPVRLAIIEFIGSSPDGEACGCHLVDLLDRSQPTISHHLKVLADAGLIEGDKRGRWVWYRLVTDRIGQLDLGRRLGAVVSGR